MDTNEKIQIFTSNDTLTIVVAEYQALRTELMYFIDSQRKTIQLLVSVAFGQVGAILTAEKIDSYYLAIFFLFVVPSATLILMLIALENTSKILLLADYIHKGIKPQLKSVINSDIPFFEWEEHKGKSRRINRKVLVFLDYTKWIIYGIGSLISLFFGLFYLFKDGLSNYDIWIMVLGTIFSITLFIVSLKIATNFDEVSGETQ